MRWHGGPCGAILTLVAATSLPAQPAGGTHADLVTLFEDWRAFETPPRTADGAPDYTEEAFAAREPGYRALRARLEALDPSSWSVPEQVDWQLVRAEMNGYDFNRRVLRPWARDPAFYQSIWTERSDVPAHEGPTHHAVTELWTYRFPLSRDEERRLVSDLSAIPPLMAQARRNLTGDARELWIAGIRNIRQQRADLDAIAELTAEGRSPELAAVLEASTRATDELVEWLEAEAPGRRGPSGIGKDEYTWYQQNVHLVPMTWEDEERLLKRELDRAWSSLKLEEHRNRDLPPLVPAATPEEYAARADRAATRLIRFLREREVVTVADYFEPALRDHLGGFEPEATRNFFLITAHHDPLPLFTHFWHWFELGRMDSEPHGSPIRRAPLLYNIFDSRSEGTATGVEEMLMHAGLYDDSPRSRELVWILLAQRAARGLGSLYAQANLMTMEEAGRVHQDFTPRGWMKTEKSLLIFEQHLYLRQPGYGTSYVTGKYLLERTLADWGRQREVARETFRLRAFFDRLLAAGGIPISLAHWELTGLRDDPPATR